MSKSWPLFVYLRPFLVKISIQIEKSTDGVLGIRTRGRRRNHGAMAATRTGDFDLPIYRKTNFLCFQMPGRSRIVASN